MNKIPFFTPLYVKVPLAFVTHHMFGRSIFLETVWPLAAYVYVMEKAGFGLARKRRLPFIVGSPSACQELMDEGFDRSSVTVVNYCVDHDVHHPTGVERSRAPLIGYFGRLKKYKSIEHLLEAAAVVRKDIPDLSVIIVGEGDHRPALEERARQLGLGTSVSFTGFVPEAKKVELLQKVWFTVYTSSKEGWGLTVMEANACGTCAVASDVPGLRDAVRGGETGLLYPYGDIGALAAAIRRLIDDAQMRRNFEQAAVAWARTFDWNDAARRTLGILQSVAEVPGSRHGAPATPSSPAPPRS
jgi:glycosyltransferase involved in cell wall biosynthesis